MTNLKNIFLFHRDLRGQDNLGFNALCQKVDEICCLFIFTKAQIESNAWFSQPAFNFMMSRLAGLAKTIPLNFIIAESESAALLKILQSNKIQRVYSNYDFTPFAQQRHQQTAQLCKTYNIEYVSYQDYLLIKPGVIKPPKKPFFRVFTPF